VLQKYSKHLESAYGRYLKGLQEPPGSPSFINPKGKQHAWINKLRTKVRTPPWHPLVIDFRDAFFSEVDYKLERILWTKTLFFPCLYN
jgi:hypothetical protein